MKFANFPFLFQAPHSIYLPSKTTWLFAKFSEANRTATASGCETSNTSPKLDNTIFDLHPWFFLKWSTNASERRTLGVPTRYPVPNTQNNPLRNFAVGQSFEFLCPLENRENLRILKIFAENHPTCWFVVSF